MRMALPSIARAHAIKGALRHASLTRAYCRRYHVALCRASAVDASLEPLSDAQQQQVEVFLDTLFDWNTKMNLTGTFGCSMPWPGAALDVLHS
jgi:16S rRNA G527 N7-methylase RsmG